MMKFDGVHTRDPKGNITIRLSKEITFPFVFEGDSNGHSCVYYENGKYIYRNFLEGKVISETEWSKEETVEQIKRFHKIVKTEDY